jgi:hypothetical protein
VSEYMSDSPPPGSLIRYIPGHFASGTMPLGSVTPARLGAVGLPPLGSHGPFWRATSVGSNPARPRTELGRRALRREALAALLINAQIKSPWLKKKERTTLFKGSPVPCASAPS